MKLNNLRSKGFTLVELIIVVVIIGILAAALLPKLTGAQAKSRDAARKADMNQLATAMQSLFNDNGAYTGDGCVDDLRTLLVPKYMKEIPSDPQKSRTISFMTNGCTKAGSYGVLPMYRNGSMSGGLVLVTRPESDGKSANFVLAQASNTNIKKYDGSAGLNTSNCDGSLGNTQCLNTQIEVTTLEPNLCKDGINYTQGGTPTGCDTATQGVTKINEGMVYIVTQ